MKRSYAFCSRCLPLLLMALSVLLTRAARAQNSSEALAINNAGVIVGWSTASDGYTHAVQWASGTNTPAALPMLSGWTNSVATAINNASPALIVGYANNESGAQHAVAWSSGTMIDLGTLSGGASSQALGVNSSGVVVGWSTNSAGQKHAAQWANGAVTDLGTYGTDAVSSATAINEVGEAVGWSGIMETSPVFMGANAVTWSSGRISVLSELQIKSGKLAHGQGGDALAINNNAKPVIVGADGFWQAGQPYTYLDYAAVEWTGKTVSAIVNVGWDALYLATGVNDSGQVVGWDTNYSPPLSPDPPQGWTLSAGTLTYLPISEALGISNSGLIVGYSTVSTSVNHAVLYTNGTVTDLGTL
ncbi:MAG TPA: hypothetical protein VKU00_31320 [Chthonomonadaceae bacterium]|nr:hypothetical protein [Chthonomonadaceae bacterium]